MRLCILGLVSPLLDVKSSHFVRSRSLSRLLQQHSDSCFLNTYCYQSVCQSKGSHRNLSLSLASLSFSSFLPTQCFLFCFLFLHPLFNLLFSTQFSSVSSWDKFQDAIALNRVCFLKESLTYPIPILSLTTWNMFLSFVLEANTAMFRWGGVGICFSE